KPPLNHAPPSRHLADGALPPSGEGAGHVAPRRRPPIGARPSGRRTPARNTWLLRTGAFSGSVLLGILRSPPCGGAAGRGREMVGCRSGSMHLGCGTYQKKCPSGESV